MTTLPPYCTKIESAWIDYNGHLRDAYYGLIVSLAVDAVMDVLGLDAAYRERTRCTLYTVEMHLHYLHEVKNSDELAVATSVLDADHKRLHLGCLISCARVAATLASADVMLLHVQQGAAPRGAAFPAEIYQALQSLKLPAGSGDAWGPRSRRIEIARRPAV